MLLSERERLMQDLHDGCIQSIYAVGLALEDCRGLVRKSPAQAAQRIARAEAGLNLVIQELRAFISGHTRQDPVDLPREIARTIEAMGVHAPHFTVDVDPDLGTVLAREQAVQLLQISREALSNIMRHANARSARISLRRRGRNVRLEVRDDGHGFDAQRNAGGGLGLHHIAARVQKLGGRLQLSSTPSKGTCVMVEVSGRSDGH